MKETIKKTLSIFLALLMLTSVLPLNGIELPDFGIKARAAENGGESTAEDSVVDSGSCGADGSDVHWTFYESGKLVISGTGAMEDYDFDEPPVRDTDNPPEEPLTEEPLTEEPSTDGAVPSPVSAVESAEDGEYGEESVKLSIGSIAAAFAQKSPLAVLNAGKASGDAEVEPYSEDGSDSAVPDPEQPTEPTEEIKKKTPWFDYTYRVKEVVVEEGITHIGDLAFACFVELTKISLPQSLIGIGIGSFAYCFKLESIPLPENLEEIGNTAFFSALSVKVLDLPQSLKKLGGAAFGYLMSVEKLEYPGGSVETDEAEPPFYCMTGLKELVIPEDAVLTGDVLGDVLGFSYSLKTVKNYSDTIALSEKMTMFQDYEAAQKYSVFVKAQYSYAIQFEAGVDNGISSEKQYYEYIIAAVNEEFGTVYTTADTNMLSEEIEPVGAGVAPYVALYCKETSAEHEACRTNGYMHYLVETDALCSCNMSGTLDSGLEWAVNAETKTLTFSGSGDIADYDLTQGNIPPYSRFAVVIENVEFADGVNISRAGDFAFSGLEKVKSLSLPEGITEIGRASFYGAGFEILILPASLQTISSSAFHMGKTPIKAISVAAGNSFFKSAGGVLYGIESDEEAAGSFIIKVPEFAYPCTYPEDVISVFPAAFENYTNTTEITLPETLLEVVDAVIYCSPSVKKVSIGRGEIALGSGVLSMDDNGIDENFAYNCNHLEEISVNPENPAFTSVDGVLCNKAVTKIVRCPVAKTGFVIPQTVTEIGYRAFDNCVMPQIDLPENVAVVGTCAFDSDWLEKIAVRNASCDISDSCTLGNTETVVYGYLGSTAEVSADKHRQRFVSFDNVEIVGITLDTSNVKTRYTVGEKLDTTGLIVYGDYSDGTRADKTAYVSFGWFDSSAPGTYTVEVRYKDFTASYDVTVEAALDYKTGDIIEFGSYPQSEVTDAALKSALTSKAGSTDGWTSYGYYISGEQSDFMKYTDVEYGGEKYRGVYFTQYRPYGTARSSSTGNSYQDDNGYNTSTVYWFKYKPMKWQVLSFDKTTGNAVVLSKDIIDSQQYYNNGNNRTIGGETVYPNNYEHSDIRVWLNGAFYDGAFTASEKNAIIATTLDNKAYSTSYSQYDSNSTTDKVWLLSYDEAHNADYGFETVHWSNSETRTAQGSAYAFCQGLCKYNLKGGSRWHLRSAGRYSGSPCSIGYDGCVHNDYGVSRTDIGVRPALKINLTSCDHVWQEDVIPPTCTERGYTLHTCTKCGAEYRDNYTAPLGHTPDGGETTVVSPTCTEKGCTAYTCSVCGEKYNDTYTDALGHDWDEGIITPPTCTEEGYIDHYCTRCDSMTRDTYTDALGHDWDEGTVTDPTCTSQGYTAHNCTRCGSTTRDTYTDPLGHTPDGGETTVVSPTCTEKGYTVYTCSVCGEKYNDTYTDALGHDWAAEPVRVEPTCTEAGYTRRECMRCDVLKNIKWDAEYASSHPYSNNAADEYTFRYPGAESIELVFNADTQFERNYDFLYIYDGSGNLVGKYSDNELSSRKVVIKGDAFKLKLTSDGSVTRYGFEIESITVNVPASMDAEYTILPALGHDWDEGIITPPTCTEQGYTKHNCTRCSETMCDTYVDPFGHDWDEGTVTDPTCTSQGYTKHRCTRCDSITYDTYTDALGHDWSTEWTVDEPVTCTKNGSKSHHCTRCDAKNDVTVISCPGHDYGEFETVKEPTCTDKGSKKKVCANCNDTVYEDIPALGHDYASEWTVDKAATCTVDGSKSHHCSRCDGKSDITVIPATGHDYGEFETVKEPTCTDKGSKKKVCANCNDTVYEDIPALGHDYASEWTIDKAATCTVDGSKSHHCSRCDVKSDITVIPATGHAYGEFETVKEPTCTDKGSKKKVCANCNDTVYEDIPALGHNWATEWTVDVPVTCTSDGSKSRHCLRCDAKTDVLSLTSSGHAFGEWVTEKAADCTKDGLETRKCATCGAVEKKVIEKLGHDYPEYTVTKATTVLCEGEERAECARCGNIDVRVIPKIQIDTDSNKNYGLANFTVVNAQTKEPIKGANLFISTENDGENTFVTDENGNVGIVLPIGRQTVSAYADGCLTRNLKINIQSGTNEIPLIGLSSKKTYDVEVNHHLMTKEEIEEAGIDTDAPENNHVFKYEVTFEFEPEIDWLSIFYYMNGNGDILGGGGFGSGSGSGGSGGSGFGSGYGGAWYGDGGGKGHFRAKNEKTGEVVNVYPVSEYFYLIIRGEVRWLKEMFDVEMLVVNNSETDTLEDLSAELELSDGLSLATMKGEQQTLKKELENVAEGKTTSAHWYVRGDKAGSYEIAASLKGMVMPFEEEINDVFKAKNALQVWAGNALHLDFEVPSSAYYAKDYPIKITLTNVSDITLYNVSHYITGIEQSRVTYYSDGKVEKEIYMKKDTNIGEFVTEFNPGDKIVIELSVNIMFQSKLMEYRLNQLIGKVDQIEQLIKAFKAIKTGLDIADGLISAIGSASKAVDSFISSASAELAEKVTLARDLKSALVDFEMAYSKFENKTVDAAVKLTNSAVGASLKAFTQEPDEWLKKTSVKDIKKLISGVKTLGNSLSGQPSKAEIKKFNVFDSIRTLISAIPIVFTLKNVFLVEDEDNTTSIPWSCTVTQSGPEYFGVANLSRHLSNILIAGSADLIKGMLPSYIFLIPGANSALSAEDAKREIIAVEKEITRFKARSASGNVTYKAYVVRNTQTQSMMLRSVSALSDGFILSSDNDTARFENGVLTFTGDGMIEVTPADLSGGTLVVEDSDGNKYEYEMTVVAQHECTPDEREVIISPTADNDGFAVDCCSVCGDVINVELLSAKECTHSYGEWVEDIAAVCNAEGLRHRDCTLCGYSESEVTEPTDRHVPGEWIIDREATCTETGEKHTVCSVCGTVSETAAIEKIAHTMTAWTVKTAATCTAEGVSERSCTECGYAETKPIAKTAHTMTGWAVKTAATCTTEGVSERSCTECGYAETKPIAKTEHTSSGWIGISAATCTEDGERCMKCTVCGAVLKTETVPAHGHADADKNGKCDNCGESLTSSCKHICHSKNKLAQFFWKMIRLMYKLFKKHEFCDCGVRHW